MKKQRVSYRVPREHGPKIVVIGGGHGLSNMLRGLKLYTENLSAIVTVADDGGGSGVLRQDLGMPPPGDIRNCMESLANAEPLMRELMHYRFQEGSLAGQSFGNLFLAALNGISPSFDIAVSRMSEVLAITGRVLPVTTADVQLEASFENGSSVAGEAKIFYAKKKEDCRITKVRLIPEHPKALPAALAAIRDADLLVLGPGSLYTSVIPNLLVGNVSSAIQRSNAFKVYVQNIMTQDGETENFTASQHISEINRYGRGRLVDVCLYNTANIGRNLLGAYERENSTLVEIDKNVIEEMGVRLFGAEVVARDSMLIRHDPLRLAYNIMLMANIMVPRKGLLQRYDEMLLGRE